MQENGQITHSKHHDTFSLQSTDLVISSISRTKACAATCAAYFWYRSFFFPSPKSQTDLSAIALGRGFGDTCAANINENISISMPIKSLCSAKRSLQAAGYDLLLLDINLPKRMELPAEADGGIELLRWLRGKGKNSRPSYIVGLTAYEESFKKAAGQFSNFIWTIVRFEYSDSKWIENLTDTLKLISDQASPPFVSDGHTYRVDVGIVTALAEPELAAVLGLGANWESRPVRYDATEYHSGQLNLNGHQISLVATAASDKGLPSKRWRLRLRAQPMSPVECSARRKVATSLIFVRRVFFCALGRFLAIGRPFSKPPSE